MAIPTDQQRWDTLGAYGNPMELTPTLDALAREGVRFERAFTPQPICGPARAAFQTGQYATTAGVWRDGLALAEGTETLADAFTDHAIRAIETLPEPFRLVVSHLEPHDQNDMWSFVAPEGYADRHRANPYVPPDLQGRPGEWYNLVGRADYRDVADALRERLGERMRDAGEDGFEIVPFENPGYREY